MSNTRKQTHKLQAALDDGYVSHETVVTACLACMSEDQVADMVRVEELLPWENNDEDDNS